MGESPIRCLTAAWHHVENLRKVDGGPTDAELQRVQMPGKGTLNLVLCAKCSFADVHLRSSDRGLCHVLAD